MQAENAWPPVPRRLFGQWVWLHPRLLGQQLAPHESFVFRWISENLPAGGTFLDVGAHHGLMSLFGARRAEKIVAFEPSPFLVQLLEYHRRVNRLVGRLEIVPKAVTAQSSESIPFYLVYGGDSSRNSLTIGSDTTPFVKPEEKTEGATQAVSLDDYCRETGLRPDLIKIDVEGAEQWVLEGSRETLERCRPCLIVSLHDYWMPDGHSIDAMRHLLTNLSYEIVDQRTAHGAGVEVRDWLVQPVQVCTER